MKDEMEEKHLEIPIFFMRCCKKVLFRPKVLMQEDKVVLEFRCPYCGRIITLESQNGLKKALQEYEENHKDNDTRDGEQIAQ